MPDRLHLQRHVGSAIAYNVWQYYQVTGDVKFLAEYGAELMVEGRSVLGQCGNARRGGPLRHPRRHGPDEYHDAYPAGDRPGLDNNAYTNTMAAWVLWHAIEALRLVPDDEQRALCERLGVNHAEIETWDRVSRRLRLPFHGDGLLSQFDGYEKLEEFDWEGYRARYGHLYRLDFILEAEGDTRTGTSLRSNLTS